MSDNSNNFSSEIKGLIENDPIPMLKKIAQLSPESMKKEVTVIKEGESSFFIKMIKNHRGQSKIQKDIIDFCHEMGYSFTTETNKKGEWGEATVLPDYLRAWGQLSDSNLAYLTQLCGKDYILSLEEKGFPLLARGYTGQLFKTLEILYDFGLDEKKSTARGSILDLAQAKKETLDFYWSMNGKRQEKTNPFESKTKFLLNLLGRIHHVNSVNDNYTIKEVNEFLDSELLKQIPQHQERWIHECLKVPNLSCFSHALKLIGKTKKGYQPEHIPLWQALQGKCSQDVLYLLLDRNIQLDSQKEGDLFLNHLVDYLESIQYTDSPRKGYGKKGEESRQKSIYEKLQKIQDYDFWLTPNKNDNNHPWFYTACKNNTIVHRFEKSWFTIKPEQFNCYKKDEDKIDYPHLYEGKFVSQLENPVWQSVPLGNPLDLNNSQNLKIFQELMNRTWFYKDENNQYAFEHLWTPHGLKSCENLWTEYLELDKKTPFIPLDLKVKLATHALKTWSSYGEQNWKVKLIENMESLNQLCDIVLPEQGIEKFKKNPEIYAKIMHAQLHKKLNNELNEESQHAKKMKL